MKGKGVRCESVGGAVGKIHERLGGAVRGQVALADDEGGEGRLSLAGADGGELTLETERDGQGTAGRGVVREE